MRHDGFHLIELLIVVAIIGLLVTAGFPLYAPYFQKEKRLEAQHALLKLALAMEGYQLENNSYAGATFTNLHFDEFVANNSYRLSINATANFYQLIAEPMGNQRKDNCGVLSLNSVGEKTANRQNNEACW